MGKYIRKPKLKLTPEASVMEMASSTIGVRTRARSLALQRLQSQDSKKQSLRVKQGASDIQTCCSRKDSGFNNLSSGPSVSGPVERFVRVEECAQVAGFQGDEDEQFVENDLDFDPSARAIRESTPCNLIRDADNISSPDSSTRYRSLPAENQTPQSSILTNIHATREMDELFAQFEQQQQRFFMEKYNFDIINDTPLPGHYEWVEVEL